MTRLLFKKLPHRAPQLALYCLALVAGFGTFASAEDLAIRAETLQTHVETLASDAFEGRMTGTEGGLRAETYTALAFEQLGLEAAGDEESWFQAFRFTAGVSLGPENALHIKTPAAKEDEDNGPATVVDEDWRPLAFSRNGAVDAAEVVFAGYGIVAPADEEHPAYDSYVHLDVTDKWVLILRYLPDDIPATARQHFARYSSLRYKAMVARDKGAAGILVATGPRAQARNELVRLAFDVSVGSTSIAALSISDALADALLASADKPLASLQETLDTGEPMMGFALPEVTLSAVVDLELESREGRNVLGTIPGADPESPAIVVGAHLDHLGRDEESGEIYYGADDNASGVAALLAVAGALVEARAAGSFNPKRDVVFGAWMGEELGLLGAEHYTKTIADGLGQEQIGDRIAANLNMDMVGRLDQRLILHGIGSSTIWEALVEEANAGIDLPLDLQQDSYLPTDATAFYKRGAPILSAFTGVHSDYHTPRDTPDKLNYPGLEKVARFMARVTMALAEAEEAPDYQSQERPRDSEGRMGMRAYLGTIPDYTESDIPGLKLSGVAETGPAAVAGIRTGDVITEVAGRKVENIYDYTYAIEALRIGETITIVVQRGEESLSFEVTPQSRD